MRRDVLAAGAKSATFAGGMGDTDYSRNLYKGTDEEVSIIPTEVVKAPRKTFVPLGAMILVRRAEAKTPAGVILADTVQQDKPAEGTVLAVGPDATTLQTGQYIVFGRYAGAEFPLNGETLLLMQSKEVLGFLKDEVDEEIVEVLEPRDVLDDEEVQRKYDLSPSTVVGQA